MILEVILSWLQEQGETCELHRGWWIDLPARNHRIYVDPQDDSTLLLLDMTHHNGQKAATLTNPRLANMVKRFHQLQGKPAPELPTRRYQLADPGAMQQLLKTLRREDEPA